MLLVSSYSYTDLLNTVLFSSAHIKCTEIECECVNDTQILVTLNFLLERQMTSVTAEMVQTPSQHVLCLVRLSSEKKLCSLSP